MKKVITFTLIMIASLYVAAQTPQVLFYGYIEEGVFVDPTGDTKKSKRQKAPDKLKNVTVYVYKGGELVNTVGARETGFYALLLDAGAT